MGVLIAVWVTASIIVALGIVFDIWAFRVFGADKRYMENEVVGKGVVVTTYSQPVSYYHSEVDSLTSFLFSSRSSTPSLRSTPASSNARCMPNRRMIRSKGEIVVGFAATVNADI